MRDVRIRFLAPEMSSPRRGRPPPRRHRRHRRQGVASFLPSLLLSVMIFRHVRVLRYPLNSLPLLSGLGITREEREGVKVRRLR